MIAQFILDTLTASDGEVELQRNELADRFNCVPSQINYVISTRFSPEHGYVVQSRRGGGGYIRIARINMDRPSMIMHTVNAIGDIARHAVRHRDPAKPRKRPEHPGGGREHRADGGERQRAGARPAGGARAAARADFETVPADNGS